MTRLLHARGAYLKPIRECWKLRIVLGMMGAASGACSCNHCNKCEDNDKHHQDLGCSCSKLKFCKPSVRQYMDAKDKEEVNRKSFESVMLLGNRCSLLDSEEFEVETLTEHEKKMNAPRITS